MSETLVPDKVIQAIKDPAVSIDKEIHKTFGEDLFIVSFT